MPPISTRALAASGLLALAACQRGNGAVAPPPASNPARAADGPPVALNPNSPVRYPPALEAQGAEGTVLLRLFVDEKGNVNQDSTRIAESSGYPALDSAALAAAPALRFAPALHDGTPIRTLFLQPIQFRAPNSAATAGATP